MGFDFFIMMELQMCERTGVPYFTKYNPETKIRERCHTIPMIEVPEDLRRYLSIRGHHMAAYVGFNNEYTDTVEMLLEEFPDWETVLENEAVQEDPEYWTEDDHEKFRALLEWCVQQDVSFRAHWSY